MKNEYTWIRFEDVSIKVRISLKAKYLQLLVSTDGTLELVQPVGCKVEQAAHFLHAQTAWIKKQAKKLTALRQESIYHWPKIEPGVSLPFLGESIPLSIEINHSRRQPTVWHCQITKQLYLQATPSSVDYEAALVKWFQRTALEQVALQVEYFGQILKRLPAHIQIKQYKRRWGSLSPDNRLSIHWRLIFAPLSVLKYVVLHEMCHLFYRNHGKRFYQLLAKHMPNYPLEEAWLRHQGFLLNFPICHKGKTCLNIGY
jgi:predicted metal-dependent hydrolase